MKAVLYTLFGLVAVFTLVFVASAFGLFQINFWGVKYENANRKVFEQTQSYVEGKRQEISKYRLEYIQTTDPQAKEAIRQTILMTVANMDQGKLSPQLQNFVESLQP